MSIGHVRRVLSRGGLESVLLAGIVITLLGILGLLGCAVAAFRARQSTLEGRVLANRLRRLIPWNLAALCVSTIGLAMVVIGMIL
ncbi:MAG: hypothetical protein OXF88_11775 [Rhodobacteraceae bacterium]|nr:hypothetical protein [Paracoccaceae bacterium]MCY4139654.1 hypothetical protein [Paracoccaceae bacterium]